MFFGIFVLNRVSNLSFFVLIRVSIFQFLSETGYLFLDDKQQNFYKLLLINIRVKCLKQGIKKSEFCPKQGRKISDICLKQGQGMRGPAAPPHQGINRVPSRPPPPGDDTDVGRSPGKHVYIFSSPGLRAVHVNVLKRGVQPAKSQKIATLCMIIACLCDNTFFGSL